MSTLTIPFGAWTPDLPETGSEGLVVCRNAIPYTRRHYVCARAVAAYSENALNARCQGAIGMQSKDGTVNIFAGNATKLYRLSSSGALFDDVSKVAGYSTDAEVLWEFAQFGDRCIATNYADAPQSFVMTSSTDFADLAALAPKARHVGVINNFVMFGNLNDATDGVVPWRVQWSGINDATSYPASGSQAAADAQAGVRNLYGDWGNVQRVIGQLGNADGAVLMQRGMFRVSYIGPPFTFQFDPVEGVRGSPAPGSVAEAGNVVYYLSDAGFMAFDGAVATPIGTQQIDDYFFANVDRGRLARISAAVDSINKIVIWSWPSTTSPSGYNDRLLIYRYDVGRWAEITQNTQVVFRTLSLGYTLDGLDSISSSIDDLALSLDSDAWVGGRPQLGFFNSSHQLGYMEGDPLNATFETGEYEDPEDRKIYVNGVKPLIDLSGTDVQVALRYRNGEADSLTTGPTKTPGSDGIARNRIEARLMRIRVATQGAQFVRARGVRVKYRRGAGI